MAGLTFPARRTAAATIALLALAGPALAQGQSVWQQNGVPMKLTPNMAASDPLGVMQIATDDAKQLMAQWTKPDPNVQIAATTKTTRHRPITTFIVFRGCQADPAGNCNVTADFAITGPTGKPYDQAKGAPIWVGHPPPPGNGLQLSATGLGIEFEDKDALGAYLVRVTVTDHVAGKVLHTEQSLTVGP
jgi:hypothetical protein